MTLADDHDDDDSRDQDQRPYEARADVGFLDMPFRLSVAANVIKIEILTDQKNLIVLGELPCDNSKSQNVLRR